MSAAIGARREQPASVLRLRAPADGIVPGLREDRPTLPAVDRRRVQLWLGLAVVLVALSAAGPWVGWWSLSISAAGSAYVIHQDRRLRRVATRIVDERILTTALRARIDDLATLTTVGRVVNSVLTIEEILEALLEAACDLTASATGSVMLLDRGRLEVTASVGPDAAPIGVQVDIGAGVAGWVAAHREPVVVTGRLAPGQFTGSPGRTRVLGGSAICAPLVAADELLGVLAVERPGPDAAAFTEPELRAVALFAEHAATAVRHAFRYEDERRTVNRLADALERRGEVVAMLVHDLKTPLSVVLGFLSVLEERWDDLDESRRADVLTAMRTQATRLRGMVDDVLRSSSDDSVRELRREPVDLAALLSDLATTFAALARERQGADRTIALDLPVQPSTVWGDPEALRHVFENLVENAVKYSAPGSSIELRLRHDEGGIAIDVRDEGEGIAPDDLPYVFDRFRQGGSVMAGGVGLGLYIVRTLVQAHGGRVTVRSSPGRGSTFTVALPVRTAARDDVEVGQPAAVL